MLRAEMENGLSQLNALLDIHDRLGRKSPRIRKAFKEIEMGISEFDESQFNRAGGAVQSRPDHRSKAIKIRLVSDMRDAFKRYGPVPYRHMATCRSIAEILKAFGVQHQQGGDYTFGGVKHDLLQRNEWWEEFTIKQMDWTIAQSIRESK